MCGKCVLHVVTVVCAYVGREESVTSYIEESVCSRVVESVSSAVAALL